MDATTRTKGLIPVNWMHTDFAPVLAVLTRLDESDALLWDTDDPEPARAALVAADALTDRIESERIRASWKASIADRHETVTILFS